MDVFTNYKTFKESNRIFQLIFMEQITFKYRIKITKCDFIDVIATTVW